MKKLIVISCSLVASMAAVAVEVIDLDGKTTSVSGDNWLIDYNGKEIQNGSLTGNSAINASLDDTFSSFAVGSGATLNSKQSWQLSETGPVQITVKDGGALNFINGKSFDLSYRGGENNLTVDNGTLWVSNRFSLAGKAINADCDKVASTVTIANGSTVRVDGEFDLGGKDAVTAYSVGELYGRLLVTDSTLSMRNMYFGYKGTSFYDTANLSAEFKNSSIECVQMYAYPVPEVSIAFDGVTITPRYTNGTEVIDANFLAQNSSTAYNPFEINAGGLTLDIPYDFTAGSSSSTLYGDGGLTKTGAGALVYNLSSGRSLAFTGPLVVKEGSFTSSAEVAACALVADGGDLTLTGNITASPLVIAATNGTVWVYLDKVADPDPILFPGDGGKIVLYRKSNVALDTTGDDLIVPTGIVYEVQQRVTVNTDDEFSIKVNGGELKFDGESNTYNNYIQHTGNGKLNIEVTNGGKVEAVIGSFYITPGNNAAGVTPQVDWRTSDSTLFASNAVYIGHHSSNLGATKPEVVFSMTNSTLTARDFYAGQDTVFTNATEGGYTLSFIDSTLNLNRFWLYRDRRGTSAYFDGSRIVQRESGWDSFFGADSQFETLYDNYKPITIGPKGLELSSDFDCSLHCDPQGEGAIVKTGIGTLTVKRAQTGAGGIVVREGAIKFGSSGMTMTQGPLVLENGAALKVTMTDDGLGTVPVSTIVLPTEDGEKAKIDIEQSVEPESGKAYTLYGVVFTAAQLEHLEVNEGMAINLDTDGHLYAVANPKTTTWTGNGDALRWSDDDNWDNGVPAAYGTVVFDLAEKVTAVTTNDLGDVEFVKLIKRGAGTAEIAGFAAVTRKPRLELAEGALKFVNGEGEEFTDVFYGTTSKQSDSATIAGELDLGGGKQTFYFSDDGFYDGLVGPGLTVTHGSLSLIDTDQWIKLTPGIYTAAEGGTLAFPSSGNDKGVFNINRKGETRLVADGGTIECAARREWTDEYSYGAYFGNADTDGVSAIAEVKNGGAFICHVKDSTVTNKSMFVVGRATGGTSAYGALRGNDSETGFDFEGNVFVGFGKSAVGEIAMTNCAFKANTISLGALGDGSSYEGGKARLSFAGGTVLKTKGFMAYNAADASVTFDGATLVAMRPESGDTWTSTNDFFASKSESPIYHLAAGGLVFNGDSNDDNTIRFTIATSFDGEGGLTITNRRTTVVFTADQKYTGVTEVDGKAWIVANGRRFAGPVKINTTTSLARNDLAIESGHRFVKIFTAPSITIPENEKDADGNYYFVKENNDGSETLCYGVKSGFTIRLR